MNEENLAVVSGDAAVALIAFPPANRAGAALAVAFQFDTADVESRVSCLLHMRRLSDNRFSSKAAIFPLRLLRGQVGVG